MSAPDESPAPRESAKHTKGPWIARDGDTVVYIQSDRASRIADVHSFSPGYGPERPERDANARLIAAAPDLLSAAIAALPLMEREFPEHGPREAESAAINLLRAAIAKAEGR